MLAGKSVIWWVLTALVAVVLFFLAQWLIPLLFTLVGVTLPAHIVNGLALLIAVGIFYGAYTR